MSRRWTPAIATTTALVVVAATGGVLPGVALSSGQPERATAYLAPESSSGAGDEQAGIVSAPDAVVSPGSREGVDDGTAERSRVRLVQSSSQQEILDRYAGDVPSYVHAGPLSVVGLAFDHPVAGPFTLSSAFGWRLNPTDVGPAVQFHIGLDYAVTCETPVRAAADGTVVSAGDRGTGGLRIDIDHGDGLVTSYRHNSQLLVSPGDRVSRGDVISLSGTTGNSTGCHLHFDTTLDGRYLDPAQLLPAVPGQPRPLDAEDLERIRAAAEQAAAAPRQDVADAAPRAEARTEARTADADREGAKKTAAEDQANRPKPPATEPQPTKPRPSADKPAAKPSGTEKPAPKPSGTTKPDQPTPEKPKPTEPKPAQPAPAQPRPSEPGVPATTPQPKPSEPAKPAEPKPTQPTEPAEPKPSEPTEPTTPEPTEPTTPEPTKPAEPKPSEPTEPAEPEPTEPAAPEPTEPTAPEPTEPAEPQPTEPADPTPTEPAEPSAPEAPPAPEALSDEEAAQWCLPVEDGAEAEAPDFSELFTGDFADLVGLVAALDEDGEPEPVTEQTLVEASPTVLWLESLPACSDAEFVEAALAARTAG